MAHTEDLNVQRYHPKIELGLNKNEVKNRIKQGLVNIDKSISTKSTKDIIKENTFTLFNFVNLVLAIAVLCVGSYKNLMFMGVVICNVIIGITQEIRAKKTVDKMNLIASNNAKLIRNGKIGKTKIEKIVLDDIILYENGNQVVADSVILEGKCEVNESLLTGEPDLITKKEGDLLLSGSYLVSGKCTARVEHVGKNNYASKLLKGSKYIKKTKSEIMTTLNKIIKIISIAIVPMGALLFYRQFISSGHDVTSAIVNTTAALTGMIPEGLVLLTSSVLAVGVMRLSKHKVLVQDIYCIETLARVDTLCLDKTGTITEGTFEVEKIVPQNGYSDKDISKSMKMLTCALNDNNETFKALKNYFAPNQTATEAEMIIPFSSEKKWSGAYFKSEGTFVFGASEFIFENNLPPKAAEQIKKYSESYRVIALAHSDESFIEKNLPKGMQLMGLILIKDKIRNSAEKTLNFFKKQGVDIKVISGDNPITVSKIAQRVNLENADMYIDATTLKTEKDISEAATKYTIFGRVTPNQKQSIVKALKENGHTVAMVGDGVNDVLAMKESDCSVAMAGGSDIARNVSHLVLLNSDFASMPKTVAEGRRAINNIQRSASLFLTKTIYSFLLALLFFIIAAPYPFIPIQMTLISTVTIGIPSFILALEPNRERIQGNLFKNIVSKSLPTALTIVSALMICVGMYMGFNLSLQKYGLLTTATTSLIGIMLIYNISVPLNKLRKILLWGVIILLFVGFIYFQDLLSIEPLTFLNILIISAITIVSMLIHDFILKLNLTKYFKKSI